MQFLYPVSRQFPVDEACEQIVRELQRRNFQVPGLTVEIDDYGRGDEKYRLVRTIEHQDFRLWFCRVQRLMPSGIYNDTAGVTEMVIPRLQLSIYEDESGPSLNLYVGDDYDRDRHKFMHSSKVHSKMDGKPRTYLQYKGSCDCKQNGGSSFSNTRHSHTGRRSPLLVANNDLGREYDPEGKEPTQFKTAEILEEFALYLESVVLPLIMACPIPELEIDPLAQPEIIPYPTSLEPLFCFAEGNDAYRIKQGQADPQALIPEQRFALYSGVRLMPLGTRNIRDTPQISFEGFIWCAFGVVTSETDHEQIEVPGHRRWREEYLIRVKPNRANDVYVADHAKYEQRRKVLGELLNGRDRFTDTEVDEMIVARAATIVPITEYQGNYEQPIVLICRELGFDEVEVVSKAKAESFA